MDDESPGFRLSTVEESLEFLETLSVVGFDTETQGLQIWGGKLLLVQLGNVEHQVVIDCTTVDIKRYKSYFESNRLFIAHNAKFDIRWLYKEGITISRVYDTYLAERILYLGYPPGMVLMTLKALCERYFGIFLDKSIRGQIYKGITGKEYYISGDGSVNRPFEEYEKHLDDPAYYGIRVNTLKISVEDFLKICPFHVTKVPWTDNGFYVDREEKPSKHPYYHAGLYYIQEPSAMTPASYLPVEPGDRVLDLCGAPGGKSTELGAKLMGEGLLVSNDVSISRTKALIRNIEMFGIRNDMILCTEAKYLVPSMTGFFNKILIDAPCSGEGMFRKGNNEIKNWQQKGSEPYAKLQREIVDDAIKLLAPGGMLLYSTCTFSPEENEQVIEYLLEKNEDLSLVPMKMCEGFDNGHPEWTLTGREDIKQCIRLWPHKIKGEGHFLALLKKADGEQPTFKYEKIKKVKLTPETEEFFKNCKMDIDWSHVREHQGKLFYLKEDIPEMKKVRVLRKGLYLGEMKKGRFEPSQSFAVALAANEYEPYLSFDINDENTVKYLKCETLDVDTNTEGIHLVGTNEFPLGWAKIKKGRLKNKYSSSWRWL